jgi:hypothetical protein
MVLCDVVFIAPIEGLLCGILNGLYPCQEDNVLKEARETFFMYKFIFILQTAAICSIYNCPVKY